MQQVEMIELARRLRALWTARTTDMAKTVGRIDTARYIDPERHALERQRLFRELPQVVALSCDLPNAGDYFTRTVADVPVVVTRRSDGGLSAFVNACRHRGAQVVEGCGSARRLVCPYHAWAYEGETGALVGIPYEEGFEGMDRSALGLTPLHVDEAYGLIAIHPTPGERFTLEEYLGALGPELGSHGFAELMPVDARVVRIATNWKLANDTGQEGYHVSFLHKDSVGPMTLPNTTLYDRYGDHHRLGFGAPTIEELEETREAEWDVESKLQLVYSVFPSTTIVVSHHLIALQRLDPGERPGESDFRLATYSTTPIETDEHRQFTQTMFDGMLSLLTDEDYATVAKVQRALSAGGPSHFVLGRSEPALQMVHAAYDRVIRA
jgi:phenylpropionate dioxygenase-like ring-hydroxylating dioxygenase large terminal subunit